jgi:hypothetical protein
LDGSSTNLLGEILSSSGLSAGTIAWLMPMLAGLALGAIAVYIYTSLAMMSIAKKLGSNNGWMAWLPFVNIYLMWELSKTAQWTLIVYFIGIFVTWIPFLGWLIAIGIGVIAIYWSWMMVERLGKPGWWAIFSAIFFPAWLVMLGILAWGQTSTSSSTPASTTPAS